jgi:hypothetical protein
MAILFGKNPKAKHSDISLPKVSSDQLIACCLHSTVQSLSQWGNYLTVGNLKVLCVMSLCTYQQLVHAFVS